MSGNVFCIGEGHSTEAFGGSKETTTLGVKGSDISPSFVANLRVTLGKSLILHRPLVFIIYCCVPHGPKLSSLKQQTFVISHNF